MPLFAELSLEHYLFAIPLALLSVFLVLVILVQRGRGGGLTGALGGMGGQSAFGTKAGDLFTRITIVVAAIWVLLSMAALKRLSQNSQTAGLSNVRGIPQEREIPGKKDSSTLPGATPPAIPGTPPAPASGQTSPPPPSDSTTSPASSSPPATTPPPADAAPSPNPQP
jgi:preprotein translocase subunit SecG